MSNTELSSDEINIEAMKEDIKKLLQSNTDKEKALVQATGGQLDMGVIAAIRVEVFIDTFLDDAAKTVYAYNLQIRMQKELNETLSKVRQHQLIQGVNSPAANKLVVPGR